jgi:hypothetical protein
LCSASKNFGHRSATRKFLAELRDDRTIEIARLAM